MLPLLDIGDMLQLDDCQCPGASTKNSRNGSNTCLVVTTSERLGLLAMKDFARGDFICSIDNFDLLSHQHNLLSLRSIVPLSDVFQKLLGGLAFPCEDNEHANVSVFSSGLIGRQGFKTRSETHHFILSIRDISTGNLLMKASHASQAWSVSNIM
jgi:hypothetical protein